MDVAAIAPYYLTLFFVPSPDFGPRDPTVLITTTIEPLMAEQGEETSLLSGCRALMRAITKVIKSTSWVAVEILVWGTGSTDQVSRSFFNT